MSDLVRSLNDQLTELQKQLWDSEERERNQRKALEFYADADNYFETYLDETECPIECPTLEDDGARAREALA